MGKSGKTSAKKKEPLTRALILQASLKIIDEKGIEALSMRMLGNMLGVEAMSLYNHVINKEDIIDGVLDLVVEEITIPSGETDWPTAMKERAVSALGAFKRHPWASLLMDSRISHTPTRLYYYDKIIGILIKAGFTLEEAGHAFSVLDSYVYGFGRQLLNMTNDAKTDSRKGAEAFADIPESYPYLIQMAEMIMSKGYNSDEDFQFGLNLIINGLEQMIGKSKREQKILTEK